MDRTVYTDHPKYVNQTCIAHTHLYSILVTTGLSNEQDWVTKKSYTHFQKHHRWGVYEYIQRCFFWDQSFQSLIFFLPVINCWLLIGRFVQGRYQIQSLTFVLWRCCVVGTVHSGVQSCLFYVEEPGTVYSNDPFAWPPNPIGCPHEMTEDSGKKEPKTKQTQKQSNLLPQRQAEKHKSWKYKLFFFPSVFWQLKAQIHLKHCHRRNITIHHSF